MALVLRAAAVADLPAVLALYRQLHADDPVIEPALCRPVFDEILANASLELIVAELDGAVVATCYLNIIPNLSRSLSPYALLENVVTEQRLRGQGLGQALVKHALSRAWARGCYKVMLQTGSRKESTHAFYRACGFRADEKLAFLARPPAERGSR